MVDRRTAEERLGEVDLCLPRDLFDVMVPEDPDQAVLRFRELFAEMFPRATRSDQDVLARGLLAWREHLLGSGILLHGLVAVPAGPELPTPAHWHLLAGVVDVPSSPEIAADELARRYLGSRLSPEHTYTETFETEIGWGIGLVGQVPLQPRPRQDAGAATDLPPVLGLAAGLAGQPETGRGLLVVGLCLDIERTLEMAAVVAAVAGNSRIRSTAASPESDNTTEGRPGGT